MTQPAPEPPADPAAQSDDAVALSIQPVIVYSADQDPQHQHPSSLKDSHAGAGAGRKWLQDFQREPKLVDISPAGQPTFETPQPSSLELQAKVNRLWAERGDFSKFSVAALARTAGQKRFRKPSPETHPSSDDTTPRHRSPSYERDAPSYLSSASDDEDDSQSSNDAHNEEIATKKQGPQPDAATATQADQEGVRGKFIEEHVFTPLWTEMLGRLDHAHVTSIHAHQLIGMLLKAYRTAPASNVSSLLAGRASSPAPSALSGSASATATAAQPRGTGDDFVLDPLSIGVSRVKLAEPADRADADEDDDDEDLDDDEKAIRAAMRDASSNEAQRLFDRKVCLAQKRSSLLSAAEILRTGAKELRASQGPERERWRGLRELKQRGWGLTPGRPLNDQYGAAQPNDPDPYPGLRGFGTPIYSQGKIKEEGARDVWVGFGAPEASVQQRRRTLAYWADALAEADEGGARMKAEDDKAVESQDKLVFPYRPKKRLRAKFVLQLACDDDGAGGDDQIKQAIWTSDRPAATGDDKATGVEAASLGEVLDRELQAAQQEFADEEIFRDIVHQSRALGSAFDVRLTSKSVSIEVTPELDLVFELVEPAAAAAASSDDQADGGGGQGKDGAEGKEEVEAEAEATAGYSPFASMALAFARFAPLRKHLGRREGAHEARTGDVFAKAQALRAQTLAVPRGRGTSSAGGVSAKQQQQPGGGNGEDQADKAHESAVAAAESVYKLNILGPIFSILHYASFVYRLDMVLSSSISRFNASQRNGQTGSRRREEARYTFSALSSIGAGQLPEWLSTLVERGQSHRVREAFRPDVVFQLRSGSGSALQAGWMAGMGLGLGHAAQGGAPPPSLDGSNGGGGTGGEAEWSQRHVGADLGVDGRAAVFVAERCIAVASISLPSSLTVQFPHKHTPEGRGLTLSLDLPTFQHLLDRELQNGS
ncbi:uncharacterized protein PFL1_05647 [Pseudozyma flocculosa PF-1]|uniref:Uncharacterized protein n=2 Tax=Pseudozyma flocculosa TaxID=84751 RepID=A0A5C3FCU2_9BASI|nr:uncharacterized protein PFL1_05647 [Pseudozyma flocculosa PF-1]EPQ26667.1 hypothetical protein PFL1_05647 [Pseudozyma flocculosa PF-1]SPO42168.1 uncharacterized protein PSFLO_07651 [Pseudozyma flocculosa]